MKILYKHINVLMMPTDFCNMNCIYCFNSRTKAVEKPRMSIETLRQTMKIIIPYFDEVKFIWHGGEPLSMGKEFFEYVLTIEKEMNVNSAKIGNSIQSNLTLVTPDYASFLIDRGFTIGGSFDGGCNEITRHNTEKILEGRKNIINAGGHCGFICVITSKNIDNLVEDYRWFNKEGIGYTINPYLSSDLNDGLTVPAEKYVECVTKLFDEWFYDVESKITIGQLFHIVKYVVQGKKSICSYNSCLGKWIGVHNNGDIYQCNRDFPQEYCFGNVFDYNDIHECFESEGFNSLITGAIARREKCKECSIYDFCSGGCNNNAIVYGNIEENNNYSCEILIPIYTHIKACVKKISLMSVQEIKKTVAPKIAELFEELY